MCLAMIFYDLGLAMTCGKMFLSKAVHYVMCGFFFFYLEAVTRVVVAAICRSVLQRQTMSAFCRGLEKKGGRRLYYLTVFCFLVC